MSLQNLKKRIKATKGVKKTTKTMELISAVYLRKYQTKIKEIKKFTSGLEEMKNVFEANFEESLLKEDKELSKVLIVLSAFRGLNGNFDALLRREVQGYMKEIAFPAKEKDCNDAFDTIIVLGKKSINWVKSMGSNNIEQFDIKTSAKTTDIDYSPEHVLKTISKLLKKKVINKEIGQIDLISMHLEGGRYFPVIQKLLYDDSELKITNSELENESSILNSQSVIRNSFKIEADHDFMKEYLLENHIYAKLYQAYFESLCAENLARTFAMKQATKSASEMIDKFTLQYNKARQAKITQEVSEIISGMRKKAVKSEGRAKIIVRV